MSTAPHVLRFSVYPAMGMPCVIELHRGALRFGRGESPHDGEIRPTEEQWLEFRERLEAIGVSDWREEYLDPTVLDGLSWSVEVVYPDLRIYASGANSYPDSDGLPTKSRGQGFRSLIRALRALSGWSELEEVALG